MLLYDVYLCDMNMESYIPYTAGAWYMLSKSAGNGGDGNN